MLKNAYLLAKIGADTAENDQHFAAHHLSVAVSVDPQAIADGDIGAICECGEHVRILPNASSLAAISQTFSRRSKGFNMLFLTVVQ